MTRTGHRLRPAALLMAGLFGGGGALAGPYVETGIAAGDPSILGWATGVQSLTRGPVDITTPGGVKASFGEAASALGPADATGDEPYPVVSLGDGGSITLSFAIPIANGVGADFAVFENGFQIPGGGFFCELAFVEVSSNGTDFYRFPSVSLTPAGPQVGTFGPLDPTNLHNLAGKFVSSVGTPFDLSDLAGTLALDLNAIRFVRITDVVGSIDPAYATHDSLGNVINDPWKTNFDAGGFDLDALAVLHTAPIPEPASTGLLALAAVFAAGWWRRSRSRAENG